MSDAFPLLKNKDLLFLKRTGNQPEKCEFRAWLKGERQIFCSLVTWGKGTLISADAGLLLDQGDPSCGDVRGGRVGWWWESTLGFHNRGWGRVSSSED